MNLLVKKFGPLAVILLSALIAISCEDPGRIGLIVNANNGVISTHYQDFVLPTTMVQFDPRKTSESNSIQSGQYTNADFGVVTSIAYSQLDLSIVIEPEPTSIYTSFEVEISFSSFIGETPLNGIEQGISIYQLAEEIDSTYDYSRVEQLALNPTPLGSWEFAPMINDTLNLDSIYNVTLDNVVGDDLFQKLKQGDPIFDNDAAFNAYFKGIALVPTLNNKDIFQINPARLVFKLNYNEFNSDGTPIARSYEIHVGNAGFYHLDSDKTGTPISGINPDNNKFTPTDDYRYLQYGTLMSIRGDLQPFFDMIDTLEGKHMIINKAELYIGQVKQYGEDLLPPSVLQVYFTDESNEWPIVDDIGRYDTTQIGSDFIMLQNEESLAPPGVYSIPLSTFYNTQNFNYSVSMSAFLQNLYSGNFHSDTEPFLEEKGQIYIFGETSVLTPQKTTSHIFTTPMAVHMDSIRLRIHYTVPTDPNQ
jgi:hypothetical protein